MEAMSRSVEDWVHGTIRGVVRLPSFQREESWDRKRVRKFLTTLIYKSRPVGVLLVLENTPGNKVFATKPISGFPAFNRDSEKCTSYLLDSGRHVEALHQRQQPPAWRYVRGIYPRAKLIAAKIKSLCNGSE